MRYPLWDNGWSIGNWQISVRLKIIEYVWTCNQLARHFIFCPFTWEFFLSICFSCLWATSVLRVWSMRPFSCPKKYLEPGPGRSSSQVARCHSSKDDGIFQAINISQWEITANHQSFRVFLGGLRLQNGDGSKLVSCWSVDPDSPP